MPKAVGVGVGCGLVVVGLGIGLGRIGGSALESMARQPEVADVVAAPELPSEFRFRADRYLALLQRGDLCEVSPVRQRACNWLRRQLDQAVGHPQQPAAAYKA